MSFNVREFQFKKKYGQNFIQDQNIINNIVKYANVDYDTLVIEIGPGGGALTIKLSEVAGRVVCYEIDESLKNLLDIKLRKLDNVKVIYKDFLKADIECDINDYKYKKIYVIANLPYYITTPIIMRLIESKINIDKIVVMVQKEVGDRFSAKPNNKDYNSLSIFLEYYFKIKKVMDVSRNVFYPKPNVDSIVIELQRREDKIYVKNEELFFKVIKDAFKYKRKNIRNNLKEYDLDKILDILNKYGYDLNVRAEALSINIFADIANNLE